MVFYQLTYRVGGNAGKKTKETNKVDRSPSGGCRYTGPAAVGPGALGDTVSKATGLSSLYLLPSRENSMGNNLAEVLTEWPLGRGPGAAVLAVSWWGVGNKEGAPKPQGSPLA